MSVRAAVGFSESVDLGAKEMDDYPKSGVPSISLVDPIYRSDQYFGKASKLSVHFLSA